MNREYLTKKDFETAIAKIDEAFGYPVGKYPASIGDFLHSLVDALPDSQEEPPEWEKQFQEKCVTSYDCHCDDCIAFIREQFKIMGAEIIDSVYDNHEACDDAVNEALKKRGAV